jgi:hypothetical protein
VLRHQFLPSTCTYFILITFIIKACNPPQRPVDDYMLLIFTQLPSHFTNVPSIAANLQSNVANVPGTTRQIALFQIMASVDMRCGAGGHCALWLVCVVMDGGCIQCCGSNGVMARC